MRHDLPAYLCILLLAAAPATAQRARGGHYLQLGPASSGVVDLNASSLRYQGLGAGGELGHRFYGGDHRLELAVAGSVSRLSSRITSGVFNRESAFTAEARVSLLRIVQSPGTRTRLLAGGELHVLGLGRFHDFPQGASETYADFFASVGASGGWEHRLDEGTVVGGMVSVPLLAAVARTPYYGLKDPPDVVFGGPGNLLGLRHVLRLERPISARMTATAELGSTLLRHDRPRRITWVEHRILAGAEVRRRRAP